MNSFEFIEMMEKMKGVQAPFKIGTIPESYQGGNPTVRFDGESAASSKRFPFMTSYSPQAGDRVLLAKVGTSYCILGTISGEPVAAEHEHDYAEIEHLHGDVGRFFISSFPPEEPQINDVWLDTSLT